MVKPTMVDAADISTTVPPPSPNTTHTCCTNSSTTLSVESGMGIVGGDSSVAWSPSELQVTFTAGFLWVIVVVGLPLNVALLAAYCRTWKLYLILQPPPSVVAINLCINNVLLVLSASLAAATLTFDLGAGGAKAGGTQTFLGMHVLLQSWFAQVMVVYCSAWKHATRDDSSANQGPPESVVKQKSRVLVVCASCVHKPGPRHNSGQTSVKRNADGRTAVSTSEISASPMASLRMSVKQRRNVAWWMPWAWLLSLMSGAALMMSANKFAGNLCLTLDPFRRQYLISDENTQRNEEDTDSIPQRIPLLLILLPVYLVGVILIVWSFYCRNKTRKSDEKISNLQNTDTGLQAGKCYRPTNANLAEKPHMHTRAAPQILATSGSQGDLLQNGAANTGSDHRIVHLQPAANDQSREPSRIGDTGRQTGTSDCSLQSNHDSQECSRPVEGIRLEPLAARPRKRLGLATRRLSLRKNWTRASQQTEDQARGKMAVETRDTNRADDGEARCSNTAVTDRNKNAKEPDLESHLEAVVQTCTILAPRGTCHVDENLNDTSNELDDIPFADDDNAQVAIAGENFNTSSNCYLDGGRVVYYTASLVVRKPGKTKHVTFDDDIDYTIYDTDDYVLFSDMGGEIMDDEEEEEEIVPETYDDNRNTNRKYSGDTKCTTPGRYRKTRPQDSHTQLFELSIEGISSSPLPLEGQEAFVSNRDVLFHRNKTMATEQENMKGSKKPHGHQCQRRVDRSAGIFCRHKADTTGTSRNKAMLECDTSACSSKTVCQKHKIKPALSQPQKCENGGQVEEKSEEKAGDVVLNINTNASSKRRTKSTGQWQGGGEQVPAEQAEHVDDDVSRPQELDAQSLSSSGDSSASRLRLSQHKECGHPTWRLPSHPWSQHAVRQSSQHAVRQSSQHPVRLSSRHDVISSVVPLGGRMRVGTAARIISSSMHHFTVQGPPPSAAHLLPPDWLCQAPYQHLPHPQTQWQHQQHLARPSGVRSPVSGISSSHGTSHHRLVSHQADVRSLLSVTNKPGRGESCTHNAAPVVRTGGRGAQSTSRPAGRDMRVVPDDSATDSIDELLDRLTYFQTHDVCGVSSEATVVDIPSLHSFEQHVKEIQDDCSAEKPPVDDTAETSMLSSPREMHTKSLSPSVPCSGDQLDLVQHVQKTSDRGMVSGERKPCHDHVIKSTSAQHQQTKHGWHPAGDGAEHSADSPDISTGSKARARPADQYNGSSRCCSFQVDMTREAVCLSGLVMHVLTCVPFAIALLPGIWSPLDCESRLLGLTAVRLLMFTHVFVCPLWLLTCHGRWLLRKGRD